MDFNKTLTNFNIHDCIRIYNMGKPVYKESRCGKVILKGFSIWGGHCVRICCMGKPLYKESLCGGGN